MSNVCVCEIEHGHFTSLDFATTGGMLPVVVKTKGVNYHAQPHTHVAHTDAFFLFQSGDKQI